MTKAELFSEYGAYHRDPRNRLCHFIGIPTIVLGLIAMTGTLRLGPIDLALVLLVATLAYYATIDFLGTLLSAIAFAVLYALGSHLGWQIGLVAFIIGWGFQLVGHRFEGSKPKFLENALYLLIGPIYIFEEWFDMATHRGGSA